MIIAVFCDGRVTEVKIQKDIDKLFEHTTEIIESEENRRRKQMWPADFKPAAYEPGLIPPLDPKKRVEKRPPLTADWDRLQWSRLLGFDIRQYYTEPLYYLRWTLEINVYRFRHFPDDTPLTYTIPIFLSVAMEPNLFGVPILYSSDHEPLFTSKGAVVKQQSDIAKLDVPDFYESGLMPLAHRFYETIRSVSPAEYQVEFPVWLRGPFGVACGIRSMEQLLVDTVTDPHMVHSLMRLIVVSRKEFSRQRRKFMGSGEVEHGCAENSMANDEVSVPIVSPRLCDEFIFPYEKELADFYGGVHWWHSCGNKTPLVSSIKRAFSSVEFIDFAVWSDDLMQAVRVLDGAIPFHVRPHSRDIAERSEEIIRNSLGGIMCICRGKNFALRVDGFQPDNPNENDVMAMRRYLYLARKLGEENLYF